MLAVFIPLTPGCRNQFIDFQKADDRLTLIPIMDVKAHCNSTLESLEHAYRLLEFTRMWLQHPTFTDYWLLFTAHDECTIVKYVMEVLRPFQYWTHWMSKKHIVALHHGITVYNDMFDQMDGMMRAFVQKKIRCKEDLFFAVTLAHQKLSKYYAEVTPRTGMLLISAHILGPVQKLQLFSKWDQGVDINPEDEISYTAQYQEAILKYVGNEYCAKHHSVAVNKHKSVPSSNLIPSAPASGSCQASCDPYDLASDDDQYLTPNNVAESTPGRSDRTARLFTAARLYFSSPPEAPKHWGNINPNHNDYHSDPMQISSTSCLLDITDRWCQQEDTHWTYTNLSNVARDIISIIPHGVRVEASFSLGPDVMG